MKMDKNKFRVFVYSDDLNKAELLFGRKKEFNHFTGAFSINKDDARDLVELLNEYLSKN